MVADAERGPSTLADDVESAPAAAARPRRRLLRRRAA
jgi:hypothetical protein